MKAARFGWWVGAAGALMTIAAGRAAVAEPPAVESRLLSLEDGGVFYEVRGTGPVVVLLHDGLLHRETWNAQWESLAKAHRVIRYDRRGYGRSPAPTAKFSDVADLAALLNHLKVPRATLVGCSAGGAGAIQFTLAHPTRVERLVLVGAVVDGMPFSTHFQSRNAAAFQPLAERGDVEGCIAKWERDPYLISSRYETAKREFGRLLRANPQNLTGFPVRDSLRQPLQPALKRLGEIRAPTLILVGEGDIPDVHAHCGAIQAGIAGSKRVVVPGSGHLVYLEQPAEFDRLVLEFLDSK
jgi:3-oxoadipate enol-lactonase